MTEPTVETLDIVGQICPASLLMTLRKVNGAKEELRSGRLRLRVLTDNRDSVGTISDALEHMGFRVEAAKEGDHYLLTVSGDGEGRE